MADVNDYNNFSQGRRSEEARRQGRTIDVSPIISKGPVSSSGYHPNKSTMYIRLQRSNGVGLHCHYDPKDFVDKYTAEYADVPVTGHYLNPIVFTVARPRKWTMKLLFNELGRDPKVQNSSAMTVDDSISFLRGFMMPKNYGGFGASSKIGGEKPPVLLVFLTNEIFICHLTDMSIKRLKIHPTNRSTLRAEIDVSFTEFVPSSK